MRQAIVLLHEFTRDKTFADYERNAMLRAAVEREFSIIGEAMTQLASIEEPVAERISEFRRIIAFRNVLVHGYASVDDRLVWNVVEDSLPTLAHEVETLLAE